jgi:hypothetical protein
MVAGGVILLSAGRLRLQPLEFACAHPLPVTFFGCQNTTNPSAQNKFFLPVELMPAESGSLNDSRLANSTI